MENNQIQNIIKKIELIEKWHQEIQQDQKEKQRKQRRKETQRRYRASQKMKIRQWADKIVKCELCATQITQTHMSRHRKTKAHRLAQFEKQIVLQQKCY